MRATRLLTRDGAVIGVEADGQTFDGQVVIATGGFERDPALVRAFLRGPMTAPGSPPTNQGDGLRLGMTAGAALGNMSEAWWAPAFSVPRRARRRRAVLPPDVRATAPSPAASSSTAAAGATPTKRPTTTISAARCTSSTRRVQLSAGAELVHLRRGPPRQYHEVRSATRNRDPDWLAAGRLSRTLAGQIKVPPSALRETIERYNSHAARGSTKTSAAAPTPGTRTAPISPARATSSGR